MHNVLPTFNSLSLLADAEQEFQTSAAIAFLAYTFGVFVLAYFSHRVLKKKNFLSEYFLGSRGLGLWALAMTFAATAASGGSFTGFPALIYSHGWILALWIASYMIVPVCTMALLGKRLNQVGRKSGAITVPEVFRERFQNPRLGVVAGFLLVFFLVFNLVAQFKAGAIIINELIGGLAVYQEATTWVAWIPETFSVFSSTDPGYCLALLVFAAAVITYTVYGGFRAVVWTDVFQGVVMFFGVLLLLFLTLNRVSDQGGLEGVTRDLGTLRQLEVELVSTENFELAPGTRFQVSDGEQTWTFANHQRHSVTAIDGSNGATKVVAFEAKGPKLPQNLFAEVPSIQLADKAGVSLTAPVTVRSVRYDETQHLIGGPGFKLGKEKGFLPFGLAVSFFLMWAISGAGQPHFMVRLMAFKDTVVYRRAIFSVSIYYSLIYIPLIIVFVCARNILPELDQPDKAMARLVLTVAPGILAGIIMAAPFAAIMSTVDSTLLVISSSLVRDIYQRAFNPKASPETIQKLSYLTTLVIGIIVMLGALNPPEFLQTIIVLTGGGCACTYLAPMFFSLYWRRMTDKGVFAGMIGGFAIFASLYVMGWVGWIGSPDEMTPHPGGLLPLVWGLGASIALCWSVSLVTSPPAPELVKRYFGGDDKAR